MAGVEKQIALQAIRFKKPLPERIKNAPVLLDGLQLYLESYYDLDSTRELSPFSVGRISVIDVLTYCSAFKFDEYQTNSMIYFVNKLDDEYLKRIRAK